MSFRFIAVVVTLGFTFSAKAGPHRVLPEKKERIESKMIRLTTGIEIEYVEHGDSTGLPLIFLHGYTDSWHSFEQVLGNMPASIHAYALSLRGHGNSSHPQGRYHPRTFATDVAAFMHAKGIQSAYIAGHSMGGFVAQQFVLDHPAMARGLILMSTAAYVKDNPGITAAKKMIFQLMDPISPQFVEAFQQGTILKPVDSSFFQLMLQESLKVRATVWKSAMMGMLSADFRQQLDGITVPTMLMWGEQDQVFGAYDQSILLSGIRHSHMIVYTGTGHALHWEEPEKAATDIAAFVLQEERAQKQTAASAIDSAVMNAFLYHY